jgi:hypothetical protein
MPPMDKNKKEEQALQKVNTSLKLQDVKSTTTVEDLIASNALPSALDTKEKIMAVIQYGKELGMGELTSLNSITLIKGKMVINSAMLGALLKQRGYEYIWTKDWEVTDAGNKDLEKITTELEIMWFSKNLNRELSNKFRMTWKELIIAGVTETNPTYKKYPKAMMRARCMTAAVRAIAPEILLGMYTIEEIADSDPNIKLKVNEETGEINVEEADYTEVND